MPNTENVLSATELFTFKWLMLCEFYFQFKKREKKTIFTIMPVNKRQRKAEELFQIKRDMKDMTHTSSM